MKAPAARLRLVPAIAATSFKVAVVVIGYWRMGDAPRRAGLATLARLQSAMATGGVMEVPGMVVAPAAIRGWTPAEQGEFRVKALRDEVWPGGRAVLARMVRSGSLTNLYPAGSRRVGLERLGTSGCLRGLRLGGPDIQTEVVLWAHRTTSHCPRLSTASCGEMMPIGWR